MWKQKGEDCAIRFPFFSHSEKKKTFPPAFSPKGDTHSRTINGGLWFCIYFLFYVFFKKILYFFFIFFNFSISFLSHFLPCVDRFRGNYEQQSSMVWGREAFRWSGGRGCWLSSCESGDGIVLGCTPPIKCYYMERSGPEPMALLHLPYSSFPVLQRFNWYNIFLFLSWCRSAFQFSQARGSTATQKVDMGPQIEVSGYMCWQYIPYFFILPWGGYVWLSFVFCLHFSSPVGYKKWNFDKARS